MTREEVENENLMGHVEDHIHLERAANSMATVDQLANSLHEVLRLNNNRTRRMRYNGREIEPFTELARRIADMQTLPEASAAFLQVLRGENPREDAAEEEDVGIITSADITDLDEVTPRQCVRLVRRSLARQNARQSNDIEMQ